jgi:hypothetical protein
MNFLSATSEDRYISYMHLGKMFAITADAREDNLTLRCVENSTRIQSFPGAQVCQPLDVQYPTLPVPLLTSVAKCSPPPEILIPCTRPK